MSEEARTWQTPSHHCQTVRVFDVTTMPRALLERETSRSYGMRHGLDLVPCYTHSCPQMIVCSWLRCVHRCGDEIFLEWPLLINIEATMVTRTDGP